MKNPSATNQTYLLVLLSCLSGAFGPPIFGILARTMQPTLAVAYFLMFGGLSMIPVALYQLRSRRSETSLPKLGLKPLVKLLALSISMALMYLGYTTSIVRGSVMETITIVRLDPLFVTILSILIVKDTRLTRPFLFIVSLLLSFLGLGILRNAHWSTLIATITNPFVLVGVATAFCLAVMFLLRTSLTKVHSWDKSSVIAVSMIIASACVFLFFKAAFSNHPIGIPSLHEFLLLAYLGCITIALSQFLQLKATDHENNAKVYMLYNLHPLLITIATFMLKREQVNFWIIGTSFLVISLATVLASRSIKSKQDS